MTAHIVNTMSHSWKRRLGDFDGQYTKMYVGVKEEDNIQILPIPSEGRRNFFKLPSDEMEELFSLSQ